MNLKAGDYKKAIESGNVAYASKDYSTAAEWYKVALKNGDGSLDIFNKIAYSLSCIEKYDEAALYYEKSLVIRDTALIRNNLGICYTNLGNTVEAKKQYYRATQLEPSESKYWRNLGSVYRKLNETEEELKALYEIIRLDEANTEDWTNIGTIKHKKGDHEGAIDAYRRSIYGTRFIGLLLFDIGTCHKIQNRYLDSYFYLSEGLKYNPDNKSSITNLKSVTDTLDKIKKIDFVPKYYELPAVDQYINPYSLLYFEENSSRLTADDVKGKPLNWNQIKAQINKRKKELKAEYELNDGKVSWYPYFLITEDVAHRVLSDLDDDGWNPFHWLVFRQPLLNNLITIGDPSYLFNRDTPTFNFIRDSFIELRTSDVPIDFEEFIEYISPYLKGKWSGLVRKALEHKDYDSLESVVLLFSTVLPLTIEDYEDALSPLIEYVKNRLNILDKFDDELAAGKDVNTNAVGNIGYIEHRILNAVPYELTNKIRRDLAVAYRNLAITQANKHSKYVQSEYLVRIAMGFKPDKLLLDKLKEDKRQVDDLIAKDKKQEEDKIQYSFKATHSPLIGKKRYLEITPEYFITEEKKIKGTEITGISYGITINYTNGFRTGATTLLSVCADNKITHVQWMGETECRGAIRSMMMLHSEPLIKKIMRLIKSSGYRLKDNSGDTIEFDRNGAKFTTGVLMFKKDHQLPWSDITGEIIKGELVISSISNKKISKGVCTSSAWNACLFPFFIDSMK
jgi:tetratricopeptide (TPR) repeat protein